MPPQPFSLTVLITCQRELLLFIQWLRRWGRAKKIPRPDQARADKQRHTPEQGHHRWAEGLHWKHHALAHPCCKRRLTPAHTPSVKILTFTFIHARNNASWSPSIKGDCTPSAKRLVIGWYHLQSCFGFPHFISSPPKTSVGLAVTRGHYLIMIFTGGP